MHLTAIQRPVTLQRRLYFFKMHQPINLLAEKRPAMYDHIAEQLPHLPSYTQCAAACTLPVAAAWQVEEEHTLGMDGSSGPICDQTDFSKEVAGLTSTMRSTSAGLLAATAMDSTQPKDSPSRYTGLSGACCKISSSRYFLFSMRCESALPKQPHRTCNSQESNANEAAHAQAKNN